MIELNSKTQHDFLNREWVQKLLDAGVDMSDAEYALVVLDNKEWVTTKSALESGHINAYFVSADTPKFLPTYAVSDLMNKLLQWIRNYSTGDFFVGTYIFGHKYISQISSDIWPEEVPTILGEEKYYIESLASLFLGLLNYSYT